MRSTSFIWFSSFLRSSPFIGLFSFFGVSSFHFDWVLDFWRQNISWCHILWRHMSWCHMSWRHISWQQLPWRLVSWHHTACLKPHQKNRILKFLSLRAPLIHRVSHNKVYPISHPLILLRDCLVLEIRVLIFPFKRTEIWSIHGFYTPNFDHPGKLK